MKQQGFTFVEMMVVVAIIATLCTIAFPSYTAFSQKGPRSQAAALLTTASQKQQQHIMIKRKYATSWNDLYPTQASFGNLQDYYQYPPTVVTNNGWDESTGQWQGTPTFEIRLEPLSGRLMEGDGMLCIRSNSQLVKFCGTLDEQVWYEK